MNIVVLLDPSNCISHKIVQGLSAKGIFSQDEVNEAFVHSVRAIASGASLASNKIVKHFLDQQKLQPNVSFDTEILSIREQEIAILISQGCNNQEIAQKLNLALQTVKNYASKIYEKLNIDNRSRLLRSDSATDN